jgi:hypothetical protein
MTVRARGTNGFGLQGMTPWPVPNITVIYDYIVIANVEQQ